MSETEKMLEALFYQELASMEFMEHGDNPVFRCIQRRADKARSPFIFDGRYSKWLSGGEWKLDSAE